MTSPRSLDADVYKSAAEFDPTTAWGIAKTGFRKTRRAQSNSIRFESLLESLSGGTDKTSDFKMSTITENGINGHSETEMITAHLPKASQTTKKLLHGNMQEHLKNNRSLNGVDKDFPEIGKLAKMDIDSKNCAHLSEKNGCLKCTGTQKTCDTSMNGGHSNGGSVQANPEDSCKGCELPKNDVSGGSGHAEGSCSSVQPASNGDTSSHAENSEQADSEENGTEPVMMRSTRRSLHRKEHTDTAVISNVFNFLQNTDELTEDLINEQEGIRPESSVPHSSQAPAETLDRISEEVTHDSAKDDGCCNMDSDPQEPKDCDDTCGDSCESGADVSGAAVVENHVDDSFATAADVDGASKSEVRMRRSRLTKQESTEEGGSDDSSDEDVGVYAESFRRSNWIRIDDDGQLELSFGTTVPPEIPVISESCMASSDVTDSPAFSDTANSPALPNTPSLDEVFPDSCPSPSLFKFHKRSESTSTTLSEREFKKEYVTKRRCLIQRQNSSKEYHRFSAKVYDDEKAVILKKEAANSDYGLHILDSQPAFITQVDAGSPAELAGVQEGQIIVSINGTNVLTATHDEIVRIMASSAGQVCLKVATSDFQPSRNLQASVIEGYMQKLSEGLLKMWKKRYFILRQDSCLYYYKHKDETDPLGAIPLAGYTFSRHLDHGRDYSFKAEKYGAKTYYFVTESRDEMTQWVGALGEAAERSKKRKESFVSVSSHNVSLPALEVRRPECTGYLLKIGHRHKTWRRRYCVLKDACLYYYKNMNSLSALGVAHLHGYKVDPWISVGKKHAFGVVPVDPTLRTFQFSAENDTDRQRWVDAMIRSIQRWIQVDNDC
ncbi:hypothetical protein BaRGS_00021443 [Batillaria attramentaria]|uniref:Uncharacterized protein n=1 Tax=Batillaria attramentaria TaxID=370345 RepID=A0ABD0KJJ5_9CAEN